MFCCKAKADSRRERRVPIHLAGLLRREVMSLKPGCAVIARQLVSGEHSTALKLQHTSGKQTSPLVPYIVRTSDKVSGTGREAAD